MRAEPLEGAEAPGWREPCLTFLVEALSARLGEPISSSRELVGDKEWLWVSLHCRWRPAFGGLAAQPHRPAPDPCPAGLAGGRRAADPPLARLRLAVEMLVRKPGSELAAQVEGDIKAMDRPIGDVLTLARGFGHEASQRVVLPDLLADLARATPGAADRVRIKTTDITLEAAEPAAAWLEIPLRQAWLAR